MKKTDRQLGYILLLQSGKSYTAEQLAAHFEICKRTVYRDIQAISEAGVPVVSLPGKGYELMEGYYLPPVAFTSDEAAALFLANQFALQQTDASVRADLNTAMTKIEAILPSNTLEELTKFKRAVHMKFYKENQNDVNASYLNIIKESIVAQRIVRMNYHAQTTDKPTTRHIEPMWLVYYGRNWHLIGYCRLREDIRDFRLDRIKRLAIVEETFILREQYKLEEYLRRKKHFEGIHEVRVRLTPTAAKWAKRWFSWGSSTESVDGDYVVMSFMVDKLEDMTTWLLSFGSMAEVLSPESLRQKVAEEARRVASFYPRAAVMAS